MLLYSSILLKWLRIEILSYTINLLCKSFNLLLCVKIVKKLPKNWLYLLTYVKKNVFLFVTY